MCNYSDPLAFLECFMEPLVLGRFQPLADIHICAYPDV